jgi:uncharacterized protein YhaN
VSLHFEQFELRAFGSFTNTTLELGPPGNGALHVICGPNEAGKTTAQRAICDFLFGIPAQSPDGHKHGYEDLRLGATVLAGDGKRYQLVRRKGKARTLLDTNGEPVDDGVLAGMLGDLTRESFLSMFSITHESLVVGGKALLAAGGNLGESLFSASLGAAGLHHLRCALRDEADELFRPRATSTRIARTQADLIAAESRLTEATLRANTYLKHSRALKDARSEREKLVATLDPMRQEQRRRDRLRIVLPKLAERSRALDELDSLAGVPELPADSEERRVRAEQDLTTHRQRVKDLRDRAEHLVAERETQQPDSALLQRAEAITGLHDRLENAREGRADLDRQTAKAQAFTAAAKSVLAEIDPGLPSNAASKLRITDAGRSKVEEALQHHSGLSTRLDESEQGLAEAEAAIHKLETELDSVEQSENTDSLAVSIAEARPHAQVEERIAKCKASLADAEEALELALSALSPPASIDSLLEASWPDQAAVAQFTQRDEQLRERKQDLANRRAAIERETRSLDEKPQGRAGSDELPSEEDLIEARGARDELWTGIKARLENSDEPAVNPDEFEKRVGDADQVADQLREEADAVAHQEQLAERKRSLEAELAEIEENARLLLSDRTSFETEWTTIWKSPEIEPRAPKEMDRWLERRSLTIERSSTVRRLQRELDSEEALLERHTTALRSGLRQTSVAAMADGAQTLSALLTIAEKCHEAAVTIADERRRLEQELSSQRAAADKYRGRVTERRQELEAWRGEWAKVTTDLGWSSDIGPDQARRQLERVVDLSNQLREAEQSNSRAEGIRQRLVQFDRDVEALVAELSLDLGELSTADVVAELARRLEQAKEADERRLTLDKQRATAEGDLRSAEIAVERGEEELASLVELAGVDKPEELATVEQQSARAADLRERLPSLEQEIVAAGKEPLPNLLKVCEGLDVDGLDARSQSAEEEIDRTEHDLHEVNTRIGALESEQRQMESGPSAAAAGQEVEQRRSELRELVDRYLRCHVAAWALTEAIDTYRLEHKGPLLERAEELFPRLTNGRFQGLKVSFDSDDEPILVGIRESGERVSVKGMSEGAREQLYLSLRQASIERHIDLHGAVPVILDDVVLHSDPSRKKAILRSLAELSQRTQVITFTHDPQVIALAQSSVHPNLLTIHEFGDGEITGALQADISKAMVHRIDEQRAA